MPERLPPEPGRMEEPEVLIRTWSPLDPFGRDSRGLILFFSKPIGGVNVWPISQSDKSAGNEH